MGSVLTSVNLCHLEACCGQFSEPATDQSKDAIAGTSHASTTHPPKSGILNRQLLAILTRSD